MALFNKEDFRNLAEYNEGICASIFVPTHRAGMEVNEGKDSIAFKNQVQEIENELKEKGLKPREIEAFTKPAYALLDDSEFWTYQSDGLAVFLGNDFFKYYSVPLRFEAINYVNAHFYLKPMVPLMQDDSKFYILDLALNNVRMFQATPYGSIAEIRLEDYIPTNMEEGLRFRDHSRSLQAHTEDRAGIQSMFHGQGAGEDDRTEDVRRFFSTLNNSVTEVLKNEDVPLVLGGVDQHIPVYMEVNSYHHIHKDGHISGNNEHKDMHDIHQAAWKLVKPHFSKAVESEKSRFRQFIGTGKAENALPEVVKKTYEGMVESLFITNNEKVWGEYDPNRNEVNVHDQKNNGDFDLLNFAAIQTVLKGGTVFLMDKESMPSDNSNVAAIYRTAERVKHS